MKKTIVIWTALFLMLCSGISLTIVWQTLTADARRRADRQIRTRLQETAELLKLHQQEKRLIRKSCEDDLLVKAVISAQLISCRRELLTDRRLFEKLLRDLNADELHVSDDKGILIRSVPQLTEGYDLSADAQSAPFMEALTNPKFRWVQPAMHKGLDGKICQFAGVARCDRPGIVQVGIYPHRLAQLYRRLDPAGVIAAVRIGRQGGILLMQGDRVAAAARKEWVGRKLEELGASREVLAIRSGTQTRLQGQEVRCGAVKAGNHLLIGYLPVQEIYVSRDRVIRLLAVSDLAALAVLAGVLFWLLQRVVFSNLKKINDSLHEITQGDLNALAEVRGPAAFRALAHGINATVLTLKELAETGRKRLQDELSLARNVQLAALPGAFPAMQGRHRFSIAGCLVPSESIGGDFYDFFPVGNDRAALVIVDVSGRGIGAALCMMEVKTLLHHFLEEGCSPAQCLQEVNRQFCANNSTNAIAAAWVALLDPADGRLTAASAGHRPPYWRHNGQWSSLKIAPSLILGGDAGASYCEESVPLAPGDRLLLYSNGAVDAVGPQQTLLGSSGILRLLLEPSCEEALTPGDWLRKIRRQIGDFTAGTVQRDDLTMVGLFYHGGMTSPEKMTLPAARAGWQQLRDFLEDRLRGIAPGCILGNRLLVAVEELFVNVALHEGSAGRPCLMNVTYFYCEEQDVMTLTLNYADSCWDPVSEARAVAPDQLAEHPDLMGMQIVWKTMDEVTGHQEDDGSYTLTLTKKMHA